MGYKIRELRLQKRLTQEELAERAGITRTTICNIENGVQDDIKVKNLKRIADALEVSLAELIE